MTNQPKTRPSAETRAEEAEDAKVKAGADEITDTDTSSVPPLDEKVAESYEEALERGANQKGEGRLP